MGLDEMPQIFSVAGIDLSDRYKVTIFPLRDQNSYPPPPGVF